MQKPSKMPTEIRPRKRTPPKVLKSCFFDDLGPRFERKIHPKRIKIESENRVEKKSAKIRKKNDKKGVVLTDPEIPTVSAYPPLGPWPYPKLKVSSSYWMTFRTRREDPRALRPLRGDRRIRGGKLIDTLRVELWI